MADSGEPIRVIVGVLWLGHPAFHEPGSFPEPCVWCRRQVAMNAAIKERNVGARPICDECQQALGLTIVTKPESIRAARAWQKRTERN